MSSEAKGYLKKMIDEYKNKDQDMDFKEGSISDYLFILDSLSGNGQKIKNYSDNVAKLINTYETQKK